MIEPVIEALTRGYISGPLERAIRAMMSSAAFPKVAFRRPPMPAPMVSARFLGRPAHQSGQGDDRQAGDDEDPDSARAGQFQGDGNGHGRQEPIQGRAGNVTKSGLKIRQERNLCFAKGSPEGEVLSLESMLSRPFRQLRLVTCRRGNGTSAVFLTEAQRHGEEATSRRG